jgi:hypothetical protein
MVTISDNKATIGLRIIMFPSFQKRKQQWQLTLDFVDIRTLRICGCASR